ncbi:MAG: B12-binding domain-containing protein [Kofleriaceae bacterium]
MKRSLSPRDLAAAIGVSESSLKRWADAGKIVYARTEGGHRRIPIAEAVRFIRATGAQLVRPDVIGLAEVAAVANDDGGDGALYTHLAAGNLREARGVLMGRYLRGESVASLCDGAVAHAMARVGELWRHDETGVFVEHRATDCCLQAVAQLRSMFDPPPGAPVALGGAPTGDPYLLPSMLAATVLAAEGVDAINLGPDTPVASLRHAIAHHRPRLVWLSLSTPVAPGLAASLGELAGQLADAGGTLVLGGRHRAEAASEARRACVVATMAELAAFARGLVAGRAGG